MIGTAREPEFLGRFWASRDPNLTTAANERRLEHYRRVWYARQNFGVHEEPWDRRGEVYVRFGEPQHRSCSNDLNFDQSLEVQRVKERLTQELYGHDLSLERSLGTGSGMDGGGSGLFVQGSSMSSNFAGPVFPVRSMGADATHAFSGAAVPPPDEAGEIDPMFETTLGSTRSLSGLVYGSGTAASGVPWESWVYTDIADGIEIVFTDESGHGMYDYAPLPVAARIPPRKLLVLTRHSPRNVVSNAVSGSPDRYRTPENKNPLGFYYDVASFRSEDQAKTLVEIYLGIPYHMGRYETDGRETRLDVTRTVALLNEATGAVYRRQGETHFRSKGDLTSRTTGFVPDVIRMEVPPGFYRMEIHASEQRFKRQSRYRQEVVVPAYPTDGLKVSELEMAWQVAEQGDVPEAFRKGDLSVVPMPTRTYGTGQAVYVYYEIYNLVRDGFGRTNYRVSYNVTPKESLESPGLIRSLMRIGRGKQETVGVTSDRQGTSAFEREYVALDMKAMRAGGLTLTVRVEDLNAGTPAEQRAHFSLSD